VIGMKPWIIIVILAAYLVAFLAAIRFAYGQTLAIGGTGEDFFKYLTVQITLFVGFSAAAASVIVAIAQRAASEKLENLKSMLTTDIEVIKGKLNANLEFIKGQFAAERKAYDELFGSVVVYYYTLNTLQRGIIDENLVKKAEDGMIGACRYTIALSPEVKEKWFEFWNESSRIAADALDPKKGAGGRKQIWENEYKAYGALYNELDTMGSEYHKNLPVEIGPDGKPVK
jgi:hypothetical protein